MIEVDVLDTLGYVPVRWGHPPEPKLEHRVKPPFPVVQLLRRICLDGHENKVINGSGVGEKQKNRVESGKRERYGDTEREKQAQFGCMLRVSDSRSLVGLFEAIAD